MNEKWLPIPGYEGRYEVSDMGRVRNSRTGKVLVPEITKRGYARAGLGGGGKIKPRKIPIHRIVALAFLGANPIGKTQVAHWNGERLDNRLANLRWVSPVENERDKLRHNKKRVGEQIAGARLTVPLVIEIRKRRAAGEAIKTIAMDIGMEPDHIRNVAKGKYWKHVKAYDATF